MASKNKQYTIPKFNSLEEEDKYWQEHSPLLEDHEGKIQKKSQNRVSFLSIRLTGDEIAKLKEKAAGNGLAPSTYARQLITQATSSGEELLNKTVQRSGEHNSDNSKEHYTMISSTMLRELCEHLLYLNFRNINKKTPNKAVLEELSKLGIEEFISEKITKR